MNIAYLIRRVHLDVNNRNHRNEHGKNDHCVKIRSHECSLESSRGGVQNDTPGNQKACQLVVHAGKRLDGRGTTEQKHGGDDNVGAEREEEEGNVGTLAPASANDFAHGVGAGRHVLEGNGEDAEEEDLDGGSRGVPRRIVRVCWKQEKGMVSRLAVL